VAIQHELGWRFSIGKMPFRQVSVEISFDLAGVAIQHGLEIEKLYAKHMLGISGLHLDCSKAQDLTVYGSAYAVSEVSNYWGGVAIQH
jgi:hypothetical protein